MTVRRPLLVCAVVWMHRTTSHSRVARTPRAGMDETQGSGGSSYGTKNAKTRATDHDATVVGARERTNSNKPPRTWNETCRQIKY